MLKNFICPDGELAESKDCMEGKCRFKVRCHPLTYLRAAGDQREWDGKPSVTQLLRGPREAYLELTTDYSMDPEDAAYRITGTKGHEVINVDNEYSTTEVRLQCEFMTGGIDNLERNPDGTHTLHDEKVTGSYKVAKAIGVQVSKVPVYDELGAPVLLKTGKNKGLQKTEDVIGLGEPDPEELFDWTMQLNGYRMLIIMDGKLPIPDYLDIHAIVRDGDTRVAKDRGVVKKCYTIPIKILPDEEVMAYFKKKSNDLIRALATRTLPPMCSDRETWGGNKCSKFCSVVKACKG